jgi:hypothetical protein
MRRENDPFRLWQIRAAHQIAVPFPGGPPTLVDGGDEQSSAAADVAGREDAGLAGGKTALFSFSIQASSSFRNL